MEVTWSDAALRELELLYERQSRFSEAYARRTVDRLTKAASRLGQFPASGRIVPEFGFPQLREVVVSPFRRVYLMAPDGIEILAVFHGAMSIGEATDE